MSHSHIDVGRESPSVTVEEDMLFVNTNHLSSVENDLPTIHVTSYGHRLGPLLPTSDISVDLRALPNPPKNIRTGQTGLSKPLRDWMFRDETVLSRFDHICKQIQGRIGEADLNNEQEVTVGVCCELGKHRSVAVVEELGTTKFDGWHVVVAHRDVHRKRGRKQGYREDDAHEEYSE